MIRIKSIASLVTKDAKVIDIGTDHAYLPIYLYQNNITHNIAASDISSKVLMQSKKNISSAGLTDKIKVIESDGFKSILENYDEAIITGMGTKTIIDILKNGQNIPKSLILSSQHNLYELRLFMQNFGYKLEKEIVIWEKQKHYVIIKYRYGQDNLMEEELILGKSQDKKYLEFLKDKYEKIYEKSKDQKYLNYLKIIEKRLD